MLFERLQWLFPVAVTVHNAEEFVAMPKWVAEHGGRFPINPGAMKIRLGLLLLTLAAFAVTYWSARRGKQSVWAYLLFGYAAAMLANVFVPHLPATLVFGEYTPGIVTAVLISLPVMNLLLFRAVREQWVSGRKAIAYGVLVPVFMGLGIAAWFAMP